MSTSYHDTVPIDHVISQDPAADESVPSGSAVDLVVSLGEPPPGVQEGFDAYGTRIDYRELSRVV